LQSFVRTRRKPDVVALGKTFRHDNVNLKHAAAPLWPDFAPSSETPGGFVGQTSPVYENSVASMTSVWPARRLVRRSLARTVASAAWNYMAESEASPSLRRGGEVNWLTLRTEQVRLRSTRFGFLETSNRSQLSAPMLAGPRLRRTDFAPLSARSSWALRSLACQM